MSTSIDNLLSAASPWGDQVSLLGTTVVLTLLLLVVVASLVAMLSSRATRRKNAYKVLVTLLRSLTGRRPGG